MWGTGGTVFSNKKCVWEPIELQILKMELANVKCKCSTCDTSKETSLSRDASDHNDAAIQVESHNDPLNRLIYGYSDPSTADTYEGRKHSKSDTRSYYRNDMYCPNCYFIWDLIRRFTKVLKDEECEIRPNMFTCDKATEKGVEIKDSATSITHKTVESLSSSLSLCEFISESSVTTVPQVKSKNNHDKVTFVDDYGNDYCCRKKALQSAPSESSIPAAPRVKSRFHNNKNAFVDNYGHGICCVKKTTQPAPFHGHCFCLDNFMETIRPPLPI